MLLEVLDCTAMDRFQSHVSRGIAAAVVELRATRRMFYTSTVGSPDVLFMVLMAGAREAFAITGGSTEHAGRDERAAGLVAETYLAGSLLCDESFVPARISSDCGHYYALNLVKDEIQLKTQVYATTPGRTCLFGVTLTGSVLGSEFVLLNSTTGLLLANVTEDAIKASNFFRDELPRLACQPAPRQGEEKEEAHALVDQALELQVSIPINGRSSLLMIKKKKAAEHAGVYSAETGTAIGRVGLGCLQRLIRAAMNQVNGQAPLSAGTNLSCFMEILSVTIKGGIKSEDPELPGQVSRGPALA